MSLYNIVNPANMVPGQPENITDVVANFQAIQQILNGGIDDANIRATAAIQASKLAGYPSDATRVLRGDGSWTGPIPSKITATNLSAGPPGSPTDGDIWVALNVDGVGAGNTWAFRYNAGSASAYKWEFIGGIPYQWWDVSGVFRQNTANANWQLVPGQQSYTLLRAGDYAFEVSAVISAIGNGQLVACAVGPVGLWNGSDARFQSSVAGQTIVSAFGRGTVGGVAANTVISNWMYTASAGANGQINFNGYKITPIRVS